MDYAYNAISQVTNKKRYSDSTGTNLAAETNHTYDTVNRLTNITHSKDGNIISFYTQSYDADNKITGITSNDGTSNYTYDDTDQLIGADYSSQTDENYTYDANGNRTNTGYVTGINNRLLEDSKYRYEYDKVGNRTKRTDKSTNEVTEYTWDIRDRLTGFKLKNALGTVIRSAQYIYDVYDQRIAKIVDLDGDGSGAATTERFVYDSNQNIALVFDEAGNLTNRYMFANGIDQIEADEQIATGTTLWALTDHLGSVRDVVDNSGTVQNHIVYDAFGNVTSQSNSSVIFRYSYTGREFDAESGLYYYRSRPLDPFTGRFIQEDKIGFAGRDANLNRYVANNAINATDPTGELAPLIVLGAGAAISAGVDFVNQLYTKKVSYTDLLKGKDLDKIDYNSIGISGIGGTIGGTASLGISGLKATIGQKILLNTLTNGLISAYSTLGLDKLNNVSPEQSTKNIVKSTAYGLATGGIASTLGEILTYGGNKLFDAILPKTFKFNTTYPSLVETLKGASPRVTMKLVDTNTSAAIRSIYDVLTLKIGGIIGSGSPAIDFLFPDSAFAGNKRLKKSSPGCGPFGSIFGY